MKKEFWTSVLLIALSFLILQLCMSLPYARDAAGVIKIEKWAAGFLIITFLASC